MSNITDSMIERGAKAIARLVPTDSGRWNDGYGHDFPREYSETEIRLIRGIARTCLDAAISPSPQETASE